MGSLVMYFSGYRDGFVEEGSSGWENKSVVMKAQEGFEVLGRAGASSCCADWEMLSLCQAIFHVSGSGRRKNRGPQTEVDFLTSNTSVRYTQVNTECAQLMIVHKLCPMKEALLDTSSLETWRESWGRCFWQTCLVALNPPSCFGTLCPRCSRLVHRELVSCSLCKGSRGRREAMTMLQMCGTQVLWRDNLEGNGTMRVSYLRCETWQMRWSHLSWAVPEVSGRARNRIQVSWTLGPPPYLQNHIASPKLFQKYAKCQGVLHFSIQPAL